MKSDAISHDAVPPLFDLMGASGSRVSLEGVPLVTLPYSQISRSSLALKRTLDILVASVGLLAIAPLLALIALRIRLDSPGPILFRQTRLGKDLHPFTMLKFRTMWQDTDDEVHRRYIEDSLKGRVAANGSGLYKLPREDAVTRVGRWLRQTSLDELPQLLNVLRGQMSLVGPRPCIPYETEHFAPHHFDRFLVPAGMTGLWQTTARARATFAEALDMDVTYALSWSFGLDLKILLQTARSIVRDRHTT